MNVIQSNLENLRLQLEKLNVRLTVTQITQLAIGLTALAVCYVFWKLLRWRKNRTQASVNVPRMRQRRPGSTRPGSTHAGSGHASQLSAAKPEQISVHPDQTEHQHEQPVAASTEVSEINSTSASPADLITETPVLLEQKYAAGRFWPVEPKMVEKQNAFEADNEEYPWADGSDYTFGTTTPVLSELLPTTDSGRRSLKKSLINAGYYSPHALQNLSAIRYLGIVIPIILFGSLMVLAPEPWEPYLIAALVIGPMLGWALPTLYVRSRATERLREIENAFPDMLDLLNMCVSQGMTVSASLLRVGKEITPVYPALAKELTIVAEQARIGQLSDAVSNLSDRVDTPEVHAFSSLMIQTEQMGTSVSEALNDYSDSMRESQKQRADEKANSATFKLLFPTVLCLMPAVFLFLMGPSLIELNRFFSNGGIDGLNGGATQAIERQR